MISIIKEICIFMLIAQTVLYFVPGSAYVKYVRVLVGILLILKIAQPLVGFWGEEAQMEGLEEQIEKLQRELKEVQSPPKTEDSSAKIMQEVNQQLKDKLNQVESSYFVTQVETSYEAGQKSLIVYLSPQEEAEREKEGIWIQPVKITGKAAENENNGYAELRKQYAALTGFKEEEIKIVSGMD